MEPAAPSPSASNVADLQKGSSYLPATVDPSLSLDAEEGLGGDPAKRLGTLYDRMRPYRRQLDAILSLCREARTLVQIEEARACSATAAPGVYDTASLCRLLVRAGGLEKRDAPQPEAQLVEVEGVAYLEPAPASEEASRFATTAAGLARLVGAQSLDAFAAMLDEEPRYESVYRILLEECANDGGATARQLEDAVLDHPELQEPRMYASYFYDRLDAAGLIAWTGPWTVTDLGRAAIAFLDGRA